MRIANGNVAMASQRQYVESGRRTMGGSGQNVVGISANSASASQNARMSWLDTLSLTANGNDGAMGSGVYNKNAGSDSCGQGTVGGNELMGAGTVGKSYGADAIGNDGKNIGIGQISQSSFGGWSQSVSGTGIRNSLLALLMGRFSSAGMNLPGLGGMSFGAGSMTISQLAYYEQESTSFAAQGQAMTEDGRQIDFNINVEMSRSFAVYTQTQIPMLQSSFLDPLVINVGSDVTQISDQKFKFDLDADGVEDEISMPTKGSAFLALDLNGDGIINDGNELFGTKSGDGFKDLGKYDSDGNGWIDENDGIFDKLRIWYKNENGEDELVSLKDADVGAIFLGEQDTQFSLQGSNGATNGMVRSTGIFLHESTGAAGTISHVDLAVNGESAIGALGNVFVYDLTGEGNAWSGSTQDDYRVAENSRSDNTRRQERDRRAETARRREKQLRKKEDLKRMYEKRQERKQQVQKMYERQQERKEELAKNEYRQ